MLSNRRAVCLLLLGLAVAAAAVASPAGLSDGLLPLSFEANEGQAGAAVQFLCRGRGSTLFLTGTEAVLRMSRPGHGPATVVRMQVVGGNRSPRLVGLDPLSGKSNYFLGSDPRQWRTGVVQYSRVRSEEVYPGIDLVYRGNLRRLEYDFVLAPQADPGRIRLAFLNSGALVMGPQGELILHTNAGDLVQPAPEVFQETESGRQQVDGRYVLFSPHQVGFAVGRYDRTRPLIIDPVLQYSTFLGGSGSDDIRAMAVDAAGNVYVTGNTDSATFPGVDGGSLQPANGGGTDVFVTKLDPSGTAILYSTFLGGGGSDEGLAIAVDGAGNAYVTGDTTSTAFPGVSSGSLQPANAGLSDAFVTKLDPTGAAIAWSTFLGGSAVDQGLAIAVDAGGSAYVTGLTFSSTFPGVGGGSLQPANAGSFDVFVTKIDPAGSAAVYSTFLGGSGDDRGLGIAVDGAGAAYLTGQTSSSTFPGVGAGSLQPANAGGVDAFVTKINPAGTAIVYSTFLGGGDIDEGRGIAVDAAGSAYVAGSTVSTTFPGVSSGSLQPTNGGGGFPGDGFVTKLNPAGTATVYSTFLGGAGADGCFAIAVDGVGAAYVTGGTASPLFPGVTVSSLQPANGGGLEDAFVTKIDPAGAAAAYSTFLGGGDLEEGRGVALDAAGRVYVAGFTSSATFPGVGIGSLQPANSGAADGFVVKIGEAVPFAPAIPALDPRGLGVLVLLLAAAALNALRRIP